MNGMGWMGIGIRRLCFLRTGWLLGMCLRTDCKEADSMDVLRVVVRLVADEMSEGGQIGSWVAVQDNSRLLVEKSCASVCKAKGNASQTE